ncbi:MAG: DUF86 domain-containing protein [Candidatus Altiarchaeota archaeon]|nr:DUF86 domain-containing protein [Candidatus Altiarchaeota archaeon]
MKKRITRLRQKLAELEERKDFIQSNMGEEKDFLSNRILRKAMYKEFQELSEAVTDICAMIVKDSGKTVEDDYSNLEKAAGILGLGSGLSGSLKKTNGLRNVLTHEYNGIIDKQAYSTMKSVLPYMDEFMGKVRKWLEEK